MTNWPEWSKPHNWDEARAMGLTEYLWAKIEVERAHVDQLRLRVAPRYDPGAAKTR